MEAARKRNVFEVWQSYMKGSSGEKGVCDRLCSKKHACWMVLPEERMHHPLVIKSDILHLALGSSIILEEVKSKNNQIAHAVRCFNRIQGFRVTA